MSVVKSFKDQEKEREKNPAPLDFSKVPNLVHTMLVLTDIIVLAYGGVLGNYLVERVCLSRIWERDDGWGGLWVFGGKEGNWELKCHCPLARRTLGSASPGNSSSKWCENIITDSPLAASKITEAAKCCASKNPIALFHIYKNTSNTEYSSQCYRHLPFFSFPFASSRSLLQWQIHQRAARTPLCPTDGWTLQECKS